MGNYFGLFAEEGEMEKLESSLIFTQLKDQEVIVNNEGYIASIYSWLTTKPVVLTPYELLKMAVEGDDTNLVVVETILKEKINDLSEKEISDLINIATEKGNTEICVKLVESKKYHHHLLCDRAQETFLEHYVNLVKEDVNHLLDNLHNIKVSTLKHIINEFSSNQVTIKEILIKKCIELYDQEKIIAVRDSGIDNIEEIIISSIKEGIVEEIIDILINSNVYLAKSAMESACFLSKTEMVKFLVEKYNLEISIGNINIAVANKDYITFEYLVSKCRITRRTLLKYIKDEEFRKLVLKH